MKRVSIIFLSLFVIPFFVSADTEQDKINQLQAQIQRLEQQKQQLQSTIAQTADQANTLQAQIQGLKNQISRLQIQIQLTGKQIDKTSIDINTVQGNIADTQQKIDYQKETIGQLLLDLHKRDNESLLGILLKVANLSDYFSETQRALTLNTKLLAAVDDLNNMENNLSVQKNNLEGKKQSLESLKRDQNAQKISLDSAQADKSQLLKATKGQEAEYQKMLVDVQNQENLFFSQLRELETHVIQGGLYIVHITAAADLPKKAKIFQWPEESPRITQGYGCTAYARCNRRRGPYNGAPHNGVDMAAGFGSPIRAIADGAIVANGRNDGWGNWVAIQHPGQYNLVSIYAHMSALSFLQVGTEVHVGDTIGYEGNTGNAEGSHLHLSLYKDFFTYVNDKKGQLYFNYFEGTVNPLDYLP